MNANISKFTSALASKVGTLQEGGKIMSTIPVVEHSSGHGGGTAAVANIATTLRRSKRKAALAGILCIIPILALTGCWRSQAAVKLPAPDAIVASPLQQDVAVQSEWVATLDSYVNAEIRPQVSGYIISQDYKEGAVVRKGQVLFELDPRPFQAARDRARGEFAQAEAQVSKSTNDVERDTPLVAQKAVPKEKLDNEIQAKRAAEAAVMSAKAAVERAELDLGWTKVTSLVDGVAGIAEVQMGNLVGPSLRLTSVSQVDPVKVYFPISEQEYLRAKHISSGGRPIQLFDGSPELILADGTVYPHKGRILWTDRQVDTNTGTIRLVAAFPNPGNVLRPGQYGRVRIQTSSKKQALLVPQTAVKELQGGYQVAVVGADKKASIRSVKVGEKVGTLWVIDDGLKADDQVVVQGIGKLKELPKRSRTWSDVFSNRRTSSAHCSETIPVPLHVA
jgi:membrane fusion protein (multidrug efflux system)